MKKIVSSFILLVLSVSVFAGCSAISGTMEKVDQATNKKEDIYEKLDIATNSPANIDSDSPITRKMTFSAAIVGEPFKMESEDKEINDKMFLTVIIARNVDKPILVQVDKVKDYPKDGFVKITGKVVGSIYYNTNHGQEEFLHVQASEIKAFEPKEKDSVKSGTYTNKEKAEFTFKEAKQTEDAFHEKGVVVIYELDAKNVKGPGSIDRLNRQNLLLYQGDTPLTDEASMINVDDFNGGPDILSSTGLIKPGTKATTFAAYKAVNEDKNLYIREYDDDFQLTFEQKLTME